MKTRILTVIPCATDATSLYRGIGPLSRLLEKHEGFEVNTTNAYDWTTYQMACDVMFMQRPHTDNHLQIAKLAKQHRKPIVLDYDDDLLSVPESNPTHGTYGTKATKHRVAELIGLADAVICSTEYLAHKVRTINPKAIVEVIRNSFDFKIFGRNYILRDEPTNNLVMWRGSKTHDADLMCYLDPIARLVEKHQKYVFHFQGGLPWFVRKALARFDNVTIGDPIDPFEYFEMISNVRPCLWLVPLEDNEFNRSKSNIAWLEAVASGSVAVCPDWEEWQVPGAYGYKDQESFFKQADAFLSAEKDPRTENEMAWNHVINNLDLEESNKRRAALFRGLASQTK